MPTGARQITSGVKWFANPAAAFLTRCFVHNARKSKFVCESSKQLVDSLRELVPEEANISIHTFDVDALYPSIPWEELKVSVKAWLIEEFRGETQWGAMVQLHLDLLEMLLNSQLLSYTFVTTGVKQFFRQTVGIATGMQCGAQLANIFLGGLDTLVHQSLAHAIYFYTRYIDDICVVCRSSIKPRNLQHILSSWCSAISVSWDHNECGQSVHFLDLSIKLINEGGHIVTTWSTYFKPLNCYPYTPWLSKHSLGVKVGVVKTVLFRMWHTNKSCDDRVAAWEFVRSKLISRGYPGHLLDVLCADFARRCELNLHARRRFDFLLPFKLPYFDGAQKLGISKIIGEELLQFGFNRLDDSLLFQYAGKTFKVVTCFQSSPNEFIKRFARFV